MAENYATITVTVMDDGSVKISEPGWTHNNCDSIDEAIGRLEKRLVAIKMEMHFENEHDNMEGP